MSTPELDASDTFRVRTIGLRSTSTSLADVVTKLSEHFKIDKTRAATVVRGHIVAKKIDAEKARALKTKLLKLGVLAKVEKSDAQLPDDSVGNNADRVDTKTFLASLTRQSSGLARDARYHGFALLVMMSAVLLPLLYFALIAGIGMGLWYYITLVPMIESTGGFLLWVAPIPIALLVMAVLVRPIFVTHPKPTRLPIEQRQAPGLYDLVRRINESSNTPSPEQIFVDSDVNAYVSTVGLSGALTNKLELTIGLPLVYRLNARELGSVIAHEFGHFSQASEIFTSRVVNTVNHWLGTCGWYKDPWELRLERFNKEQQDLYISVLVQLGLYSIRGMAFVFRKLHDLNLRMTRRLSQEMEFNADDHAVELMGSKTFVASSIYIRELMHAHQQAWQANYAAYNENKLFINVPQAICALSRDLPEETKAELQTQIDQETTNYWSTHPADRERIKRAQDKAIPNLELGDMSATHLFKDVDTLAQQATQQTYTRDRGLSDAGACVVENHIILNISKKQGDSNDAIAEFFGDAFTGRVLNLAEVPDYDPPTPVAEKVLLEVAAEKARMMDLLFISSVYAKAGIELPKGTWQIDEHNPNALSKQMSNLGKELRASKEKIQSIHDFYHVKLIAHLAQIPEQHKQQAHVLYSWVVGASVFVNELDELSRFSSLIGAALGVLSEHDIDALRKSVDAYATFSSEIINRMMDRAEKMANPLLSSEPGQGVQHATVADFLEAWHVNRLAEGTPPSRVEDVADNLVNGVQFLYQRALGELAYLCLSKPVSQE